MNNGVFGVLHGGGDGGGGGEGRKRLQTNP